MRTAPQPITSRRIALISQNWQSFQKRGFLANFSQTTPKWGTPNIQTRGDHIRPATKTNLRTACDINIKRAPRCEIYPKLRMHKSVRERYWPHFIFDVIFGTQKTPENKGFVFFVFLGEIAFHASIPSFAGLQRSVDFREKACVPPFASF